MRNSNINNKEPLANASYAFTPYRICPLGAHVDHQKGPITGFAIDKGIHIEYEITENGLIGVAIGTFAAMAYRTVYLANYLKKIYCNEKYSIL